MPELPDLEAYSRNLEKSVSKKIVKKIILYQPGKINADENELNDAIFSSQIISFQRDGKEMLLHFDNGNTISVHLMLEGKFYIPSKIDSIDFKMLAIDFGEKALVISDPSGWAKMKLNPKKSSAPDALSDEFSLDYFLRKLKEKKSKNIKAFLIDQGILRGIGNAYADEILWEAKVSPESKAGHIPDNIAEDLYNKIREVLVKSVDEILKIKPDVINGEVRSFLKVHRRDRKICPNGFPIICKRIASKTTYYTEEQELY